MALAPVTASLVIGIIVSCAVWILHTRRDSTSARRHLQTTCSPISTLSSRYLLGLDTTWTMAYATRHGTILVELSRALLALRADTFHYRFIRRAVIFTAAPVNHRAVLAGDFRAYELPATRTAALRPVLGASVFSQDGAGWQAARAALRPGFAPRSAPDLRRLEEDLDAMLARMVWNPDGLCEVVDLYEVFGGLAINHTMGFLFGRPPVMKNGEASPRGGRSSWHDMCTRRLSSEGSFLDIMDFSIRYSGLRVAAGAAYWLFNSARYRCACRAIHAFVDEQIAHALSPSELRDADTFSFARVLARHGESPEALRAHLTTLIQAGVTLSFLFQNLASNPATFAKLRSVVLATFGSCGRPHDVVAARLRSCAYLQHCINETLRLFPTVAMNARTAKCDTVLPVGGGVDGSAPVFVAKGTKVQIASFITHRLEDVWGPDAHLWRPERWEGMRVSGWEKGYLPFSGGPRACLGQHIATTTIAYITARLVQCIDALETHHTANHALRYNGVSLGPVDGVRVRLRMPCRADACRSASG